MKPTGDLTASEMAEQMARAGQVEQAYRRLQMSMAGGDAMSAFTLAQWRMTGQYIRRDLVECRNLFSRAIQLGLGDALPFYIALLGNGGGSEERNWTEALRLVSALAPHDPWAKEQAELIEAMGLDPEGDPKSLPRGQDLHTDPLVKVIPGFFSPRECAYVCEMALPMLQPSQVYHPQSGKLLQDPIRTALVAGFPFLHEDPVLHALNRRIMAETGTSYDQGEPMQVLSYEPGQEYKLHSDTMPGETNQRARTFLVTLTDDFDGGETSFPRLGLDLRGKPGDAFYFSSLDSEGQPDELAWHAGKPVTRGRKLMLSKWIRERPLDLSGPPGRPF